MLDLTQTIEQAEKLGYEYFADESVDYFDFPYEGFSLPFANFIHSLAGFQVLTSTVKTSLSKANENIKYAHDNAKEGAQFLHAEKGKLGIPLSAEHAELFKQMFGNLLGSIEIAHEVYLSMYVTTLVSKFEAYLQEIVKEIAKHYPATMKSGKMVSINDVLQFDEMPALIEFLAENSSLKITEGTASEYINGLGNKFGIPICQFKDLISEVEYFVDIRHLQVHKNGIVDHPFHRKYKNIVELGKPIKLDFDLLAQMSRAFRLLANLIEIMLTEKFPEIAVVQSESEVDDVFIRLERIFEGEKNAFTE